MHPPPLLEAKNKGMDVIALRGREGGEDGECAVRHAPWDPPTPTHSCRIGQASFPNGSRLAISMGRLGAEKQKLYTVRRWIVRYPLR